MQTNEHWVERISIGEYANQPFHTSRYEFAANFVAGKVVLDVACGVGYGSQHLATRGAKSVIGIDVDKSALQQRIFDPPYGGIPDFAVGNAIALPIANGSVDVVISMETIEHIRDVDRCLAEFRRVLTDSGVLVLSTPNALVTKPVNGVPRNPFHVKEYTPEELLALLSCHFTHIELLGQRIRGTVLPEDRQLSTDRAMRGLVSLFPLSWRQRLPRLLPQPVADALVRLVTGHRAVIQSSDLEFAPWGIESSPVLIAICRKA